MLFPGTTGMKRELDLKQAALLRPNGLLVSEDGYVRVPLSAILAMRLTHFLSGLDDDSPEHPLEGGCSASISGYTEWLTNTDPVITVGWDWYLDLTTGAPVYVRDGLPRTNLMALDGASAQDIGDLQTGALLATLIDRSGWQDAICKHIATRYA